MHLTHTQKKKAARKFTSLPFSTTEQIIQMAHGYFYAHWDTTDLIFPQLGNEEFSSLKQMKHWLPRALFGGHRSHPFQHLRLNFHYGPMSGMLDQVFHLMSSPYPKMWLSILYTFLWIKIDLSLNSSHWCKNTLCISINFIIIIIIKWWPVLGTLTLTCLILTKSQ